MREDAETARSPQNRRNIRVATKTPGAAMTGHRMHKTPQWPKKIGLQRYEEPRRTGPT